MILGIFFGVFLITTFTFMTSQGWLLFLDTISNKYSEPDEGESYYKKVGALLVFSLIITGISIYVIYNVHKNNHTEQIIDYASNYL